MCCNHTLNLEKFSKKFTSLMIAQKYSDEDIAETLEVDLEIVKEWKKAKRYPDDKAKKGLIDLMPELKEFLAVEEEAGEEEVVKTVKKKSQNKQFIPLENTDPDSVYSRSLNLTGVELRTLRQKAGLTQEQLGAACNYSAANISFLESREEIYFQAATRVLVTLDEVLGKKTANPDLTLAVPEPIQERSIVIEDTKTFSTIMRVYLEENAVTRMATPAVIVANQLLMQASGQTIAVKEEDFDALREVLTDFVKVHFDDRFASREMALAHGLLYEMSEQAENMAA